MRSAKTKKPTKLEQQIINAFATPKTMLMAARIVKRERSTLCGIMPGLLRAGLIEYVKQDKCKLTGRNVGYYQARKVL